MKQLSIDIETYSSTNLNQTGVYRYANSDDFELLLFGYAVDFGQVKVVDLTHGEKIPPHIIQALNGPTIIKSAFNAHFERVCLSHFVGRRLKPTGWHCSRVWAANLGLPLSLHDVGTVLGLPRQKITAGKELVRYFCSPFPTSQQLTGLANPNSPLQLKDWLHWQGVETDSLAKASVAQILQTTTGTVHQVLALRQLLSKSSVKKYQAMQKAMCKDGRVHGLLQFYGATQTNRWAGRLVQVQNLPRNSMPDLEESRELVRQGNFTALAMLYGSVPDVLSQLIQAANQHQDCDALTQQIMDLRKQKEKVQSRETDKQTKLHSIDEINKLVELHKYGLADFDEQLVRRLVEKITIFKRYMEFTFKDGEVIKVNKWIFDLCGTQLFWLGVVFGSICKIILAINYISTCRTLKSIFIYSVKFFYAVI